MVVLHTCACYKHAEVLSYFASVFCLGYGDIRDIRLSRSRRLPVPRVRYKFGETSLRRSEMQPQGFVV